MATVIHERQEQERDYDGAGTGIVVGILVVVLLAILFLVFGLPYLSNRGTGVPSGNTTINVELPSNAGGTAGELQSL